MSDPATTPAYRHGPARPRGVSLALGLLLAPAAWFLQTNLAQTFAAWGCFPHDRPVAQPAMRWLEHGELWLAAIALLLALTGAVISWRNWRATQPLAGEIKERGTIDRHVSRDVFLARAGTLASALFVFALLTTDLAYLLVSPCGGR